MDMLSGHTVEMRTEKKRQNRTDNGVLISWRVREQVCARVTQGQLEINASLENGLSRADDCFKHKGKGALSFFPPHLPHATACLVLHSDRFCFGFLVSKGEVASLIH